MKIDNTAIFGVQILTPEIHKDERGSFREIYRKDRLPAFVQDNIVVSKHGVLRGIHFQPAHPQGKLFMELVGEVYEVVVDIRQGSETFGKWVAVNLSASLGNMLYVPPGFAWGTYVVGHESCIFYKVTEYYDPENVMHIAWDDPDLDIPWPLAKGKKPILSPADCKGRTMREIFK